MTAAEGRAAVMVEREDDHIGRGDDRSRGRPSVWDAVETDVLVLPAKGQWRSLDEAAVRGEARRISPALAIAAVVTVAVGSMATPAAALVIGALVGLLWHLSEDGR